MTAFSADTTKLIDIAVKDDPDRAFFFLIMIVLIAAVVVLYRRNQGLSDKFVDMSNKNIETNLLLKTSNDQMVKVIEELTRRI